MRYTGRRDHDFNSEKKYLYWLLMSPPNCASRCAHYLTNADVMGAATAVQLQGVYDLCAPLLPCFLKYVRKISLGKVDQSMAP